MNQVLESLRDIKYKTEIINDGTIKYVKLEEEKC